MEVKNIIYSIIFIIFVTSLLYFSVDTTASITTTIELYIQKVFPSLFLFVLFTNIILTTNAITYISETFKFLPKLFNLPKEASTPILLGFLCGFPSASSAIDKLYTDNKLTKNECFHLMSFCNNASPIFIISTIGSSMLSSKEVGYKLFFIHIFSSIIIGIIYSILINKYIIQENTSNLKYNYVNKYNYTKKNNISNIISSSILSTFKTMVYILAYMLIFNIFSDILNSKDIPNIQFLTSTFELTKGISNFITLRNLPYISFLIGFSSLSIIFQIKSSLKNLDYPIYKLILFKLLHGALSFFSALIIF